jgi:hypothetical protein
MTQEQLVALLKHVPIERIYEAIRSGPAQQAKEGWDLAGWDTSREEDAILFQHSTATEPRDGGILCLLAPEAQRTTFDPRANRLAGTTSRRGYQVTILTREQLVV